MKSEESPILPHFAEVEGRHGRIIYPRLDAYIGRSMEIYGEYSELELTVLCDLVKPGETVIEAGANIGALTVPLARHVGPDGKVIAFEPQPVIFQTLTANIAANDLSNVVAHPFAVGAVAGMTRLEEPDYGAPGNFGGIGIGEIGHEVSVVCLDDAIGDEKVHLIKMDIEGTELDAVNGAERLIARNRPLLYLENGAGPRSAPLIQAVMDLDYQAFWHLPMLFNPDNFLKQDDDVFPGVASVNMVCIPIERRVHSAVPIADPTERPLPGV